MEIKFFRIPVNDPLEMEGNLNSFLTSRKILTIQREFVAAGQDSFWALAIEYLDSMPHTGGKQARQGRKDYKQELSTEVFALFSHLREWRKKIADQQGIPVYTVFTNEQLARIAAGPIINRKDLKKVEGVGAARLEKFGQIVDVVRQEVDPGETTGKSVSQDS